MRRQLLLAPIACPLASSQDACLPLWDRAFRRITPGALCLCCAVLSSRAGGRS